MTVTQNDLDPNLFSQVHLMSPFMESKRTGSKYSVVIPDSTPLMLCEIWDSHRIFQQKPRPTWIGLRKLTAIHIRILGFSAFIAHFTVSLCCEIWDDDRMSQISATMSSGLHVTKYLFGINFQNLSIVFLISFIICYFKGRFVSQA